MNTFNIKEYDCINIEYGNNRNSNYFMYNKDYQHQQQQLQHSIAMNIILLKYILVIDINMVFMMKQMENLQI